MIATFYVSIWPVGGSPSAEAFFNQYLTAFIILVLYLGWMIYTRDWTLLIKASDMDVTTGIRMNLEELLMAAKESREEATWANLPKRIVRALI